MHIFRCLLPTIHLHQKKNGSMHPNVEDGHFTADVKYKKRLEDVVQPLYPFCGAEHTKLSTTVELLSLKARCKVIDCGKLLIVMVSTRVSNLLLGIKQLKDQITK